MASVCPKCHVELEDDAICCAELKHAWKCRSCGKFSTGFAVPYGRCYLCGGEVQVVKPYDALDKEAARLVEEAVTFELEMYQFYRLAREHAGDETQRAVFEQLYLKEMDHISELEQKYHVHLPAEALDAPPEAEPMLAEWIFEGIDFDTPAWTVKPLYEKALLMERRTRDHFARRAMELPAGSQKEICRELAAEEEEHVSILETELAQFETENAISG